MDGVESFLPALRGKRDGYTSASTVPASEGEEVVGFGLFMGNGP